MPSFPSLVLLLSKIKFIPIPLFFLVLWIINLLNKRVYGSWIRSPNKDEKKISLTFVEWVLFSSHDEWWNLWTLSLFYLLTITRLLWQLLPSCIIEIDRNCMWKINSLFHLLSHTTMTVQRLSTFLCLIVVNKCIQYSIISTTSNLLCIL